MPKKRSAKQKRFLQIVEHNPDFAKKVGMKPATAKEMLHPYKTKKAKKRK